MVKQLVGEFIIYYANYQRKQKYIPLFWLGEQILQTINFEMGTIFFDNRVFLSGFDQIQKNWITILVSSKNLLN